MAGVGARDQGEANAPKNARNGGVEGENRVDRRVAGAPTHSGELFRTRGTYRARLSASTRCGRMRRSCWRSRRGRRGPELAGREAPSHRRRWRAAEWQMLRASERGARARVEELKWQRAQQRMRPSAPGGRPGRVQAAACSPRGGQSLPARHGGTAWPSARGHGAGAGAGKGVSAGGLGRLRPAGQK